MDGARSNILSVVSGSTNNKKGGARHMIKKITIHAQYIELKQHDIALLELEDEFQFDDSTQPIEYDEEFIEAGENCILTGWGYTVPIRVGSTPDNLQRVELPVISNKECKQSMEGVTEREICTFRGALAGACGVRMNFPGKILLEKSQRKISFGKNSQRKSSLIENSLLESPLRESFLLSKNILSNKVSFNRNSSQTRFSLKNFSKKSFQRNFSQ